MRLKTSTVRRRSLQRGNALVESALALLAFMTLILGLMEFAVADLAYNFVAGAARDASRYASVHGSQSDIPVDQAALLTWVQARAVGLNASRVTLALSWEDDNHAPSNNNPGSTVVVIVRYEVVPMVMPNIGTFSVGSTSRSAISH